MVRIISRHVLAKGQVVIPKSIRDELGIHTGDEIRIEKEEDRIIIYKGREALDIFEEVAKNSNKKITMKEIKKELEGRYEEE